MDPQSIKRRGVMLVLSSPSGTGKSTISRNLLAGNRNLELSVSVTTRARRGSEIDGTHYHFVTEREFNRLRDDDALLEWAEVHGNYYGTPREAVDQAMGEGRDVLFDIDYQGGQQLMEKARFDVVSVFLLPPSMEELQSRLVRRAEDAQEVIQKRLNNAIEEIPHWKEYDYVVINDDLDRAFSEVQSILTAERLRRERSPGLFDYEQFLLGRNES
ncbi:MAG: guanylate kinase [Rhizobiaceae bacterium]|nr:guanylate kinase [Rhizobiaceae bacterium]